MLQTNRPKNETRAGKDAVGVKDSANDGLGRGVAHMDVSDIAIEETIVLLDVCRRYQVGVVEYYWVCRAVAWNSDGHWRRGKTYGVDEQCLTINTIGLSWTGVDAKARRFAACALTW